MNYVASDHVTQFSREAPLPAPQSRLRQSAIASTLLQPVTEECQLAFGVVAGVVGDERNGCVKNVFAFEEFEDFAGAYGGEGFEVFSAPRVAKSPTLKCSPISFSSMKWSQISSNIHFGSLVVPMSMTR